MKEINKFIALNIDNQKIVFNIKILNERIYTEPMNILNHYGLVLDSYFKYITLKNDSNFIEFLKFNVENNQHMNDYLTECLSFKAETYMVNFETINGKDKVQYYGLFVINNRYHCYAIGGSILVKDINTNKVYFYYCD